jgi:DNA polymerase III subunit beta
MNTTQHTSVLRMPKRQLREALTGLSKVLNRSTALPVLRHLLFETTEGLLTVTATDLDQTVTYRFSNTQAEGTARFIIEHSVVNDLTQGRGDLRFKIDAPDMVTVTTENGLSRQLTTLDTDEWPASTYPQVELRLATGFLRTFRRCSVFASIDDTRQILNGVHIAPGTAGAGHMVATDGKRLTCFNSMSIDLPEALTIKTCKFLLWKALGDDCELGTAEIDHQRQLCIRTGSWTYWSKPLDGTFPDWDAVIPTPTKENEILFGDEDVRLLKESLKSLPGQEQVVLRATELNKLIVAALDPDSGRWSNLLLPNSPMNGLKATAVDRNYLQDALDQGFRSFAYSDELSPLRSDDDQGGLHVLMPMRVPEVPTLDASEEPKENTAPPADEQPEEPDRATPTEEEQMETPVTTDAMTQVADACATARTKVREVSQTLAVLNAAIKQAAKDKKAQDKEMELARTALVKLQAISL